jgi:hypothetical protein
MAVRPAKNEYDRFTLCYMTDPYPTISTITCEAGYESLLEVDERINVLRFSRGNTCMRSVVYPFKSYIPLQLQHAYLSFMLFGLNRIKVEYKKK